MLICPRCQKEEIVTIGYCETCAITRIAEEYLEDIKEKKVLREEGMRKSKATGTGINIYKTVIKCDDCKKEPKGSNYLIFGRTTRCNECRKLK